MPRHTYNSNREQEAQRIAVDTCKNAKYSTTSDKKTDCQNDLVEQTVTTQDNVSRRAVSVFCNLQEGLSSQNVVPWPCSWRGLGGVLAHEGLFVSIRLRPPKTGGSGHLHQLRTITRY